MKVVDLGYLADEIAYALEGKRNALGAIQDSRTFAKSIEDLDGQHNGAYAFLAFHPKTDTAVVEMLSETSLGDDAGRKILVLFFALRQENKMLFEWTKETSRFGVDLVLNAHPAYELAQELYGAKSLPAFPGLILFDRLKETQSALYIPLSGDKLAITDTCRKVLSAARSSLVTTDTGDVTLDFDMLMGRMTLLAIEFRKNEAIGIRGAGLILGAWLLKNGVNLVSALPKALEAIAKGKGLFGGALPPTKSP